MRGELLAITLLFHYTHKGPTGHNIFPSRFKSPLVLNANDIKHTANIFFSLIKPLEQLKCLIIIIGYENYSLNTLKREQKKKTKKKFCETELDD